MLVLSAASAVCSVVKIVVADVCWEEFRSSSFVSLATWLATIWAAVGGVGSVAVCAKANMDVNAKSAKGAARTAKQARNRSALRSILRVFLKSAVVATIRLCIVDAVDGFPVFGVYTPNRIDGLG